MSEKKMISSNTAITLGIVSIILGASLVGTTVYFLSALNERNSIINQKEIDIADLNDTINFRKYAVWVNKETVTQTPGNYTTWIFTDSVLAAGYIEVLITPPPGKTYAETLNNTYIEVICNASVPVGFEANDTYYYLPTADMWSWHYYDSDIRVNLSSSSAPADVFPILPWVLPLRDSIHNGTSMVEIRIGNTNTVENVTETVLITYYY